MRFNGRGGGNVLTALIVGVLVLAAVDSLLQSTLTFKLSGLEISDGMKLNKKSI